jgi:hypothetical protein
VVQAHAPATTRATLDNVVRRSLKWRNVPEGAVVIPAQRTSTRTPTAKPPAAAAPAVNDTSTTATTQNASNATKNIRRLPALVRSMLTADDERMLDVFLFGGIDVSMIAMFRAVVCVVESLVVAQSDLESAFNMLQRKLTTQRDGEDAAYQQGLRQLTVIITESVRATINGDKTVMPAIVS